MNIKKLIKDYQITYLSVTGVVNSFVSPNKSTSWNDSNFYLYRVNPLKYKAKLNDVSIPQKTKCISITKTDYFRPNGEIKTVREKHIKNIKYCVGSMPSYNGKASGTYRNHCALKG